MTAHDHQDLDGRWGELDDKPVGEAGGIRPALAHAPEVQPWRCR
jgi:hypothetical protein